MRSGDPILTFVLKQTRMESGERLSKTGEIFAETCAFDWIPTYSMESPLLIKLALDIGKGKYIPGGFSPFYRRRLLVQKR